MKRLIWLATHTNYHIGGGGLFFNDIGVAQVAVDQSRIWKLFGNLPAPLLVANEKRVLVFRMRLVQRVQCLTSYVSCGSSSISSVRLFTS
jgi:hypothetical protein